MCAFEYLGPHVSEAIAAASTPAATAPTCKVRSAAFGATFLALKLPVTQLLLRIRRPAKPLEKPLPAEADAAAEHAPAAEASTPVRVPARDTLNTGLRPNWVFFCQDDDARRHVVRLLLLGEVPELPESPSSSFTLCTSLSVETKACKWYASATKAYMERGLSPRIFAAVRAGTDSCRRVDHSLARPC